MKKAKEAAVRAIEDMSRPVTGREQIAKVAAISAGNEEVGEMIADAIEKVSENGVITIEESKTMKTEIDVVEGMQFDKGYVSSYMCDDKEKMTLNMENPYILITDKKISNIQDILPVLEQTAQPDFILFQTERTVLIRCNPFIFPKLSYKVTKIIKSNRKCDIRNRRF